MTFDTIRFKLLNLSNYEDLAFNLVQNVKVSVGGMRFVDFTNELGEVKEDEFLKAKITSASYDINYSVNVMMNYALFEFSIPKYLYGHNLKHYPEYQGSEIKDLHNFFTNFFMYEFKIPVNLQDITIERIDLCYNYTFQSIENKQAYKSHLFHLFKNTFGEHNVLSYDGLNTIMYKTQDYSFKIYDKGEEFRKHDYKKIRSFYNKDKADFLQNDANLILRAELTFRKRKISYDFFHNIEKTNQVHNIWLGQFMHIKKINNDCMSLLEKLSRFLNKVSTGKIKNEKIDQEIIYLKNDQWKKYSSTSFNMFIETAKKINSDPNFRYKLFTPIDINNLIKHEFRRYMKQYNKITSPKQIRLELTPFEKRLQGIYAPSYVILDQQMFEIMNSKFKNIYESINNFQTSSLSPIQVLSMYKNTIKIELNINIEPLKRYLALKKHHTKKQLEQKKIFPRATIYRYESQINEIDKFLNSVNKKRLFNVALPEKMHIETNINPSFQLKLVNEMF